MATDLQRHKMSVGGKMSKWPMRPIWATCRDRNSVQSEDFVNYMVERAVSDLKDLRKEARKLGMETDDLEEVITTLNYVDGDDVVQAVNVAYGAKFRSSDDYTNEQCPFERTGNESMCKTCPVGKTALVKLKKQATEERGRED